MPVGLVAFAYHSVQRLRVKGGWRATESGRKPSPFTWRERMVCYQPARPTKWNEAGGGGEYVMELCKDKEDVYSCLNDLYVITQVLAINVKDLMINLEHSRFNYDPFKRNPKWFEHKCDRLTDLANRLESYMGRF